MIKKKGVLGKLNNKQFSEWKASIGEMQKAELHSKIAALEYNLLQKDVEINNLKLHLHQKNRVEGTKEKFNKTKDEYERIKIAIEQELGYSLNDKSIDEVTLEIRDLKNL